MKTRNSVKTGWHPDGSADTPLQLDNPAIMYYVVAGSDRIQNRKADWKRNKTFPEIIRDVESWNRVTEIPDGCDEWCDFCMTIMGGACNMRIMIARKSWETFYGYLKIISCEGNRNLLTNTGLCANI